MAQKAYCGAAFTVVDGGVLIITSTGTHLDTFAEFYKAGRSVLEAATEHRHYFIEPTEALNMGVQHD